MRNQKYKFLNLKSFLIKFLFKIFLINFFISQKKKKKKWSKKKKNIKIRKLLNKIYVDLLTIKEKAITIKKLKFKANFNVQFVWVNISKLFRKKTH